MIMTDINFIVVFRFYKVLPGGYWFLIFGPVLDGLLGGSLCFRLHRQSLTVFCRCERIPGWDTGLLC